MEIRTNICIYLSVYHLLQLLTFLKSAFKKKKKKSIFMKSRKIESKHKIESILVSPQTFSSQLSSYVWKRRRAYKRKICYKKMSNCSHHLERHYEVTDCGLGYGSYMGPVSTWTCEPRAKPDVGLFMSLSPHRVPDRSHPRQHRSQSIEFPSIETLVITVYYRHCHYIVSYSSVCLLSEL